MNETQHDRDRRLLVENFPAVLAGRALLPCQCPRCEAERKEPLLLPIRWGRDDLSSTYEWRFPDTPYEPETEIMRQMLRADPEQREVTLTELKRLYDSGVLSTENVLRLLKKGTIPSGAPPEKKVEPTHGPDLAPPLRAERQFE